MRVPEEPVCIHLFYRNPVFTSLHLKSPVHVVPPQEGGIEVGAFEKIFLFKPNKKQIIDFTVPPAGALLNLETP